MDSKTQSILFMVVAVSLFALLTLIAKALGTTTLGQGLHPVQITTARFCFALLIITPWVFIKRPGFKSVPWRLHLYRGASGWLGISCLFTAASTIPLADANAITFLSVIVTMALSIPMLGEQVGAKRWIAALIALLGALVLVKPGTQAFHPAALFALLAALFIGFEAIFVKQLTEKDRPIRILFINNSIGAIISLCLVSIYWIAPTWTQWSLLAILGMSMVLVQYCFIQAIGRAEASFVTPFWYAAPVFAAVYDGVIFGERLTMTSGIGIALIIIGGVVICKRS